MLAGVRWRRLVLDEAQQIKNSAARTTQSVRSIPAERRIAMTGTPVENRLSELWSIMEFLNPGILGSERSFRERFADPIEREGDDEAATKLRRITGPFVLRRLKTDRTIIADLPEKLEMKEFCNLTREQATLYQAVVDDMLARIDEAEGIERRGLVLATMMKLKQVCNHPAHFLADGSSLPGRSGKLTRLVEVLGEAMAEGDRSLVFTQFTEMGSMLERHLRQRPALRRALAPRRSDEAGSATPWSSVSRTADGPPVFLLSLKAGGTGLNLTAATQVVHFDRWWNPAVEDQATDRAYRIGQKHNVQVRKFVCGGTLEERIDAMIEAKRALAERIVGTGEGWLTELSTDQLREVIALSADAVGGRLMPRDAAHRTDPVDLPTAGGRRASKPIAVEGGVKARSQRGQIGDTWWSRRFITVLESFDIGSRLQRGKRYARTGQVLSLEIVPGQVHGLGPGLAVQAVPGVHRDRDLDRFGVDAASRTSWRRGPSSWPSSCPARCPRRSKRPSSNPRPRLFPASDDGPRLRVFVPRLGEPVQARRRGLLPDGGSLRRRSLPHLRLAGPGQGQVARRPQGATARSAARPTSEDGRSGGTPRHRQFGWPTFDAERRDTIRLGPGSVVLGRRRGRVGHRGPTTGGRRGRPGASTARPIAARRRSRRRSTSCARSTRSITSNAIALAFGEESTSPA